MSNGVKFPVQCFDISKKDREENTERDSNPDVKVCRPEVRHIS